jgi:hypothetical protein
VYIEMQYCVGFFDDEEICVNQPKLALASQNVRNLLRVAAKFRVSRPPYTFCRQQVKENAT